MINKQIQLLISLLVLFGILTIAVVMFQGTRPIVNSAAAKKSKILDGLEPEKVASIGLKKGGVEVKLEKKDKSWFLATSKNRAASTERVDSLLNSLKEASVVDTREGAPTVFEMDDAQRLDVTLHRESGDLKLIVGKNSGFNDGFVRKEGDETNYEIDKSIDSDAGVRTESDKRILDPAWFYDLKVFKITADDIIDVAIKKGHDVIRIQRVIPGKGPVQPKQELVKDDPKPIWWITEPEGFEANDATINSICSNLANLNAKSYADAVPEKDRGLDKPTVKVKLILKDGTEHNLAFGKIDGDDVVMSVSGKSDPYKVYKYVFDTVNKELADLKKKEEDKKDEKKDAGAPAPKFQFPPNMVPQPGQHPVSPAVHLPPPPPPPPAAQAPAPVLPPAVVKDPNEKK